MGHGRLTGTTRVIVDAAQRLSRLLLTQLLINVGFGILFALGLYFLGVDFAILWGFLTAVLRFVPYLGTWIAALLPLTLSFATAPDWTQPILVLLCVAILDAIAANVIEPLLLGRSSGVFPMALLAAAAFWTWLWGPIGLLLSTPLTVCLVVLGQHFPQFHFFTLLLGDQPPLKPAMVFYQRLLARDQTEAQDLAVKYARASGLAKACDDLLLPALLLAGRDHRQAGLTAEDERFIFRALEEILGPLEQGESERQGATAGVVRADEETPSLMVFGCPAHDETEELSLRMLRDLLRQEGCHLEVLSTKLLPAEIDIKIARQNPALIFISVLPPGGLIQCRYLCKHFHKRFVDIPIVVGYWGDQKFDTVLRRLRLAGAGYVATGLSQAQRQIATMVGLALSDENLEPVLQGVSGQ